MEILTNILGANQFREEFGNILTFLKERGVTEVAVTFGFDPNSLDLDDVGDAYTIPVAEVAPFVADREREKGFRLGESDLWIDPLGVAARFLFCNDRDIHLTSESADFTDAVRAEWRSRGYNIYPDDLEKPEVP